MFNRLRKPAASQPRSIRETLFGDMPLTDWPPVQSPPPQDEPWVSFVGARTALNERNTAAAIRQWRRITEMPNLEARQYLQAWHFLRQAGVQPPPDTHAFLYGVVVEVAMTTGLDLLAAYADGSARYYNDRGAGVVWDRPDASLDTAVTALLAAGRPVAALVLQRQLAVVHWERHHRDDPFPCPVAAPLLVPAVHRVPSAET